MSKLRAYQQQAIDDVMQWMSTHDGNPCAVLPTGAGKSHIVAAFCKQVLQEWPETRILMLTHVKELIEQNASKMREHWPGAPMGIYSAGLRKKQLGEPITFAGIQSIRNRAADVGHVDIVIIDECHLVSHKDEGGYREFLKTLKETNKEMRVIGLTATPYRLGHGKITDGDNALFSPPLIDNTPIEMLLAAGHLAPLRSKVTAWKYDMEGVHTRGGDFVESEMQARVDTEDQNIAVCKEVIALAGERRHWLFFCAGVIHAHHIATALNDLGVTAACVSGETPPGERAQILADFKAGKIKAVTNANVLTTGFDFPDIDLIAMLRPTKSIALYVQMAGRGLRPKSHTDHCMVLDFAGVVMTHGPVTRLNDDANNKAMKKCPGCNEVLPVGFKVCPVCGHEFPTKLEPTDPAERKMKALDLELRDVDIMGDGLETESMDLAGWTWRKHTSRTSGKDTLAVTYYGGLADKPITEYLCVTHEGYAGERAWQTVSLLVAQASRKGTLPPGILSETEDLEALASKLSAIPFPQSVRYRQDGKFLRVVERVW